ncbi:MAG: hypothetical protein IKP06_04160 [Elusimicrobiaceae bacterium]|nr:hypothetical protein [Elusimicrobiaceae bacterium]
MKLTEKIQGWEVCIFAICAWIILLQCAKYIDFENALKKDSPTPVHIGGPIQRDPNLPQVTVTDIPDSVYKTLDRDSKFKRYLTGNHKYVVLFAHPNISSSEDYAQKLRYAFSKQGFAQYYRKRIYQKGSWFATCPNGEIQCASLWLHQTCFGNLCLLNPVRKQAVIVPLHHADQLPALLEAYKEW